MTGAEFFSDCPNLVLIRGYAPWMALCFKLTNCIESVVLKDVERKCSKVRFEFITCIYM